MKKIFSKSYSGHIFDFTLFSVQKSEEETPKIIRISFEKKVNSDDLSFLCRYFDDFTLNQVDNSNEFLDFCAIQIYEFMCGKRFDFTVPFEIYGSQYKCQIMEKIKSVFYGEIISMHSLEIDVKKGSAALLSNPLPLIFPCHRINARGGETTAYVGGIPLKRKLLDLEYETKTGGNAIKSANDTDFDYAAYEEIIPKNSQFSELLEYAKLNNIPLTKPETIALIKSICAAKSPKYALEIGCAIGYSAMEISPFVKGELITLERDEERAKLAKLNFKKYRTKNISLIIGDALETLDKLTQKFDFVYIDAAKGQNMEFFTKLQPLLSPGAVLVFDNTIYKGLLFDHKNVKHKARTMVKKMGEFLDYSLKNEDYTSSLVPIGDGILIMVRKY